MHLRIYLYLLMEELSTLWNVLYKIPFKSKTFIRKMKLLYDWIALCFWVPAIEADEMTKRTLPQKDILALYFLKLQEKISAPYSFTELLSDWGTAFTCN